MTHNNQVSQTQDEGLDVFKRDIKGSWKIVNYLSYMSKEASDSNRSTPYNEGGWGVGRAEGAGTPCTTLAPLVVVHDISSVGCRARSYRSFARPTPQPP